MLFTLTALFSLLLARADVIQRRKWTGARVYKLDESSINHDPSKLAVLQELRDYSYDDLSFWSHSDLMLTPRVHDEVVDKLKKADIHFGLKVPDVQAHFEASMESFDSTRWEKGLDDSFFDAYHTYAQIETWATNMSATYNGAGASGALSAVVDYLPEKTYQGNEILRMTITGAGGTAGKKIIYYEHTIHAREWIATTSGCYVINQLLTLYASGDADVTSFLDNFVYVIIPVVNVDGYLYTWSDDRNWRKTRRPNDNSPCVGTDPNRNWDNHWCEQGASSAPCSDSYCGPKAFSEDCVVAVSNYIAANAGDIEYFGDMHTYGSMVFGPYGWTCDQTPPDYQDQMNRFEPMVETLESVSGHSWLGYGTICNTIYAASGSSVDWGYQPPNANQPGITYSFGAELEGNSFSPPASAILKYGQDWWAGIATLGQEAVSNM